MLFPALLPQKLIEEYASNDTDDVLFHHLLQHPADLLVFFDYACDDETWSQKHFDLLKKILTWITMQSFQGKLTATYSSQLTKIIRQHYEFLRGILPCNLIFKFADTSIQVNSALYSSASPYFRDLIQRECFDKKNFKLEFREIFYSKLFCYVEEFVNKGEIRTLWKLDQDEILRILHYAVNVQMPELSKSCEEALAKYLTNQNVYSFLSMSQKESLGNLKETCCQFLNNQNLDLYFESNHQNTISCRFIAFSEKALEAFELIHSQITHLVFPGDVANHRQFPLVIKKSPKLISIDLSNSNFYPEYLSLLPSNLQEINLTSCEWLTSYYLKKIAEACPNLRKIVLSNNLQLTANAWGELMRFRGLSSLEIANCPQIRDEDFKIILHSCSAIVDLNLEECRLITEKAFFDLSRACGRLRNLNLARTSIGDPSLIEIASRCRSLNSIDLTRCTHLTDKGLLEFIRHSISLQSLNVANCSISKSTINEINRIKPTLHLISSFLSL